MNKKKSLEEGLEVLKKRKKLLGLLLVIICLICVSWIFSPDTKQDNKDKELVVDNEKVDFNVELDSIESPTSAIFSSKKGIELENNPFKKKEQEQELDKEVERLENLGITKTPDPYKNESMWKLEPSGNNSLGINNSPKKRLSEKEKRRLRIEQKRKEREKRRLQSSSKSNHPKEKVKIKAYVYRKHNVLPYYSVELTLITPFTYKGKYYDTGFSLSATVKGVKNNKVFMTVDVVGDEPIKLKAYDPLRKHEGLYFIQAGILEQELKGELEKGGLDKAAKHTKTQIAKTIVDVINSDKKNKLTKIPLDNDYEMILKNY